MTADVLKGPIISLMIALAGGGISWAVHEMVDSNSAKALLLNRVAENAARLERQSKEIKRGDDRVRQLEVAFARQAETTRMIVQVLERSEGGPPRRNRKK